MQYFQIVIKDYYYHEAYGNRSGVQIIIERNSKELGTWLTEDDIQKDKDRALITAKNIAMMLAQTNNFRDSDRSKDGDIFYIYDYYSIGD